MIGFSRGSKCVPGICVSLYSDAMVNSLVN